MRQRTKSSRRREWKYNAHDRLEVNVVMALQTQLERFLIRGDGGGYYISPYVFSRDIRTLRNELDRIMDEVEAQA